MVSPHSTPPQGAVGVEQSIPKACSVTGAGNPPSPGPDDTEPVEFRYTTDGDVQFGGRSTGFYVAGTNRAFVVDERRTDNWYVTHLLSGRRIILPDRARLSCRRQADGFVRRFYTEGVAIGAKFYLSDLPSMRGWYTKLSLDEQRAFWERVL